MSLVLPIVSSAKYLHTPEGVELYMSPAGPIPRVLAYLIDNLVKWVFYFMFAIVMSTINTKLLEGVMLITWFFVEWFYPVFFEIKYNGMTPGKRSLGLRVLHDDGTPIRLPASMLRNILLVVDLFPFFYGLGLTSMLVNKDFKRVGDLAAGTLVVHALRKNKIIKSKDLNPVTPEMPPHTFEKDEQKALIAFAENISKQNMERNIELANILENITGTVGLKGVNKILAYAIFLMGKR